MAYVYNDQDERVPCRCGLAARRASASLSEVSTLQGRLLHCSFNNFDLGVEYNKANGGGTTWAQEQFYKLLDYRYRMGMPTLITTNVPLDRQESRLASRLQDHQLCKVVHNPAAPDYRRSKRA